MTEPTAPPEKNWFSGPFLFDGGVGTELYERGFFINRPFEELNLSAAADVIGVHEGYLNAGADWITLNTFSLTAPQLKTFDIVSDLPKLMRAALANGNAARAKYCAKNPDRLRTPRLALSLGPLGLLVEPLGAYGLNEAEADFEFSISLALRAEDEDPAQFGFDAIIFETFTQVSELRAALRGAARVFAQTGKSKPLIASMALKSTQDFLIKELSEIKNAAVLALNCLEGPSDLLKSLKKLRALTAQPILIQPNAGVPNHVNGRYVYMTSPDYLGKFAKRFIEAGANGVGGCCGTGPEHIRAMQLSLKMTSAQARVVVVGERGEVKVRESFALEPERCESRVLAWLKNPNKNKVLSVEMLPPKGGITPKFLAGLQQIRKLEVGFVNFPDGARAQMRLSSLHAAAWLENKAMGLSAIPHLTTRDRNLIALQSDLLGAYVNQVRDLLLVTGDPPKLGNNRDATAVYDIDSIGLTFMAACLNRGVLPNGDVLQNSTAFGIGVASNPTAINLALEQKRWEYKVESGAHYTITQPLFNSEAYRYWRENLKRGEAKTDRPHIVGIWPLLSFRNAEFMANEVPGIQVPKTVLSRLEKYRDTPDDALKEGVDIACEAMTQLSAEVEGFCLSAPLGRMDVVEKVLERFST